MKVIYNTIIPFSGYKCMNFFGILFVRKGAAMSEIDLNHERIHTKQMQEMLWLFFYLWYCIEYLIVRFRRTQNYGYHDISLEEEAHNNEENLDYLKTRKHYAWFRWIKRGSYVEPKKDYIQIGPYKIHINFIKKEGKDEADA